MTTIVATPEFQAAVDAYCDLQERGLDTTEEGQVAFLRVMNTAPESLRALLRDKAREYGLLPNPAGYQPDGTPVYALQDVADKMGVSIQEAASYLRDPDGHVDPNTVTRVQ